jgi:hypothetical protein
MHTHIHVFRLKVNKSFGFKLCFDSIFGFWTHKSLGLAVLHTQIVAMMVMHPVDGHYCYDDGNATPSSYAHFGVLRKKKKRKKSFDGDGDAPLTTLKFTRRKTQGSNHLMFVT